MRYIKLLVDDAPEQGHVDGTVFGGVGRGTGGRDTEYYRIFY